MKNLLLILVIPFLILYCSILGGFTIVKLWAWFVVPTFHLAPLSFFAALGLSALVSYFMPIPSTKDKKIGEVIKNGFIGNTIKTVVLLGFGYIYHLFM
jgi:hypothetical protein